MEAIFYIGIAQSLYVALILFTKKSTSFPDRILGFWMIFIAAELFHILLDIQDNPLYRLTSNFSFYSLTFGPFIYLYTTKLLQGHPIFTWKDSTHFYAYIILALIHLVFFTHQQIDYTSLNKNEPIYILYLIRVLFLIFSLIIYGTLVFWIISRHQKQISKSYSFESPGITLNWIRYTALIFILVYLMYAVIYLLYIMNSEFIKAVYIIPGTGLTLIAFIVSYYAFRQPTLLIITENEPGDYSSQLNQSDLKSLETRIRNFMDNNQPYLNPTLTLQELSTKLDMPVSHVSQVINGYLDNTFYSYINKYRVDEAKNRLTDPKFENKATNDIGIECGFYSKNSFLMLFERYANMPPNEYRKKYFLG